MRPMGPISTGYVHDSVAECPRSRRDRCERHIFDGQRERRIHHDVCAVYRCIDSIVLDLR